MRVRGSYEGEGEDKTRNKTLSRNSKQSADLFIDVSADTTMFPNYLSNDSSCLNIKRLINLIFGNPYVTPKFSEHAMFIAFCNSIHSSDLSRQVGAALCKDNQIIALGANECHQPGGLPYYSEENCHDFPGGKDYTLGYDSNAEHRRELFNEIIRKFESFDGKDVGILEKVLRHSELNSITEYGRMVHAEMDAITNCAMRGIPTYGCTYIALHFLVIIVLNILYHPELNMFTSLNLILKVKL